MTTENGKNPATGEYDRLYTYGARSFSIRRADTMELVYDSGDELGHKTALLKPELFNCNFDPTGEVSDEFDTRSDDKVKYKTWFGYHSVKPDYSFEPMAPVTQIVTVRTICTLVRLHLIL